MNSSSVSRSKRPSSARKARSAHPAPLVVAEQPAKSEAPAAPEPAPIATSAAAPQPAPSSPEVPANQVSPLLPLLWFGLGLVALIVYGALSN